MTQAVANARVCGNFRIELLGNPCDVHYASDHDTGLDHLAIYDRREQTWLDGTSLSDDDFALVRRELIQRGVQIMPRH